MIRAPGLIKSRTEVTELACEGEPPLMTAVGALETRKSGGEIAAAEEGIDGGGGGRVERTEGRAVIFS